MSGAMCRVWVSGRPPSDTTVPQESLRRAHPLTNAAATAITSLAGTGCVPYRLSPSFPLCLPRDTRDTLTSPERGLSLYLPRIRPCVSGLML